MHIVSILQMLKVDHQNFACLRQSLMWFFLLELCDQAWIELGLAEVMNRESILQPPQVADKNSPTVPWTLELSELYDLLPPRTCDTSVQSMWQKVPSMTGILMTCIYCSWWELCEPVREDKWPYALEFRVRLKYSYRLGVLSIVVHDAPWLVVAAWCHLLLSWATMGASVTWQCAPLCKQWIDRAAGDSQHTKKLHQYLVMRSTCFYTTEWRQARVFLCGDQAQLPLRNLKAMNRIWIVSPIYKWQDAFSPHLSRLSVLWHYVHALAAPILGREYPRGASETYNFCAKSCWQVLQREHFVHHSRYFKTPHCATCDP